MHTSGTEKELSQDQDNTTKRGAAEETLGGMGAAKVIGSSRLSQGQQAAWLTLPTLFPLGRNGGGGVG